MRAALIASVVLLGIAIVAPTALAASAIYSGSSPNQPINIRWAEINDVPTTGDGAPLTPVKIEFKLTNNPKSITFNGVNTGLDPNDEVRIQGFTGTYSITGGNIKFTGMADSWEICTRDTDGDGLLDCAERYTHGTDPLDPDTDGDGLTDGFEVNTSTTDPLDADTDDDGLNDGYEVNNSTTNPKDADTDDDGLTDGHEVLTSTTDPKDTDTDDDGLGDGYEVLTSTTDPKNPDTDGDGLSDGYEVNTSTTNPKKADTDNDGLSDSYELNTSHTDPKDADSDNDGLNDGREVNTTNTDPLVADSDADGLNDGREVNTTHTDPLVADTDGDGLADGREVNTTLTDPNDADTDDDGLSDGLEVDTYATDPRDADTDDDTLTDGAEVGAYGCSPLLVDTDADTLTDPDEVGVHGTDCSVADTDAGGVDDASELAHETDPLYAADDLWSQVWTEDEANGTRAAPIDVAWVKVNNVFVNNTDVDGVIGNVRFDVKGTQWLWLNGTNVEVGEGSIIELEQFVGFIEADVDGVGEDDFLRVDGHASKVIFHEATHEDETEGALVHTHGRIASHEDGTITVDIVQEAEGMAPVVQSQTFTPLLQTPVPLYLLYDFWKFQDDLTSTSPYQVSFTPGQYQGQEVIWVEVFNEDPTQVVVPLPAGTPLGQRACVTAPPPPTPPNCL